MMVRWSARLLAILPGLALAVAAIALAREHPSADTVTNAIINSLGVLMFWGIAIAISLRYPTRPLGALLYFLAGAFALQVLVISSDPILFTLSRVARPAVEVAAIWVMLAFPSGSLQGRREKIILLVGVLGLLLVWFPAVMSSQKIPLGGPFILCHPDCPRNALFVADLPELSKALLITFRTAGAGLLFAVAFVLFQRYRKASRLMRRTLAPVLFASIIRALTVAVYLILGESTLIIGFTLWAIPLALALGLLRGRMYMAKALQRLVSGLRGRPDMQTLRDVMASALEDESLELAFWVSESARWVDSQGREVALPAANEKTGRAVTMVEDQRGLPIAALIHDVALLEEPTLVDAVASSMQAALEAHRMAAALVDARASTASAVEEERHRIERDLHDGAQQRLISLRMKLAATSRVLKYDVRRAAELMREMDADVAAAFQELRAFSHGMAPPLLVERGLVVALSEAASCAAIPTRVALDDVGQCDAGVTAAIYFCCLEALQNAAKHAPAGSTATLSLTREGDQLSFCIANDGDQTHTEQNDVSGHGLRNMRERMAAIGGTLRIDRIPGQTFCVIGQVGVGRSIS